MELLIMKKQLTITQAFEKALALQKSGSITQAKKIYEDILQEHNTNFDAHHLLGVCHYQLKDFTNSIQSIKKAIELNPNDLHFYVNLGNSYSALKQYEQAEFVYKQALQIDPNDSDTYLQLGNCYKKEKDYKNALIYFKKAIKVNNQCYLCYHQVADTYNKLYKLELSIFYLQKAIRICPDFYEALFSMAQCYRKMKNEEKMIEYLHKTLAKLPEHPGANHLLASLNKETSSKYSSEYARDLFDRYADYFEDHLVRSLKYQVPFIIKEKLISLNPPKDSKILDLGCGTGLLGKTIVDIFPNLVGVDISSNMIEETRKKDIYSALHVNDIHDFLLKNVQGFDLIIAADVFIYIGDLQTIFSRAKKSLNKDGYFIFTTEFFTGTNQEDYQLAKNGRFSHNMEYVESLCQEIGFEIVDKEEIILREENQTEQKGVIFTLKIL
jgi:predicted TPR repeat methyltransferase